MRNTRFAIAALLLLSVSTLLALPAVGTAQSTTSSAPDNTLLPNLPDAPLPAAVTSTASAPVPEVSTRTHDIDPGEVAPILTDREKVAMGFRGTFSPFAATAWLFASGYEQAFNRAPNWGSDRGAYGLRLGDAVLRGSSEDLLRGCAMVPLFHEDPRYYRLGSGHGAVARFFYAATRPLVSRDDSGRDVANLGLLTGNLAGSALTNAYYPRSNRTVGQTFFTFGSGIAGAALGDELAEFFGPFLDSHFHLSR